MPATAISVTVNDAYLAPAVVLLESFRGNIPSAFPICVRDTGLSPEARSQLHRQAESIGSPISFNADSLDVFGGANLLRHVSDSSAFARLLPYAADEPAHRHVLELDVDILVRAPLHDLLAKAPRPRTALMAVPTHFTSSLWAEEVGETEDLGLRDSDSFFMGGVWIVDTREWDHVSTTAIALYLSDPPRWRSELSVLNVVCSRSWEPLEPRWNVWTAATRGPLRVVRVTGAAERSIARSNEVAIAHFPGHFKPWLPHYPPNRWRHEYRRVARRSVLAE